MSNSVWWYYRLTTTAPASSKQEPQERAMVQVSNHPAQVSSHQERTHIRQTRAKQGISIHLNTEASLPNQMDTVILLTYCTIESERFYQGLPHDTRFAHELFRRALVECNEQAWEYIYNHYGSLVESWVRRCGAFSSSGESSEFFVVSAFARFWGAITPERFATFPTLASLLHYLQLCTACVVIDSVRAQSWAEILPEEAIPATHTPQTSPDEEVLEQIDRIEFWKYINTQLNDETEQVVVFSSFVSGMKPSEIYRQRQDLFASVNEVYNIKRNVLGRLSRNQELRNRL